MHKLITSFRRKLIMIAALVAVLAALAAPAFAQAQLYLIHPGRRADYRFAWDPVDGATQYKVRCGWATGIYDRVDRSYGVPPSETLDFFFPGRSENFCAAFAVYTIDEVEFETDPSNEVRIIIAPHGPPNFRVEKK